MPVPDPSSLSILDALMAVIARRRALPPGSRSYVKALDEAGLPKIGAKITEEAAEVVEAAGEPGDEGRAHLVREAADLVFHTLVLLGHRGIDWGEVEVELARRFGISGLDEKEGRGKPRAG
ncbi:MAG: phosphoribosyl-ATP diphosphatase [Isosphaeraceae bacterium]